MAALLHLTAGRATYYHFRLSQLHTVKRVPRAISTWQVQILALASFACPATSLPPSACGRDVESVLSMKIVSCCYSGCACGCSLFQLHISMLYQFQFLGQKVRTTNMGIGPSTSSCAKHIYSSGAASTFFPFFGREWKGCNKGGPLCCPWGDPRFKLDDNARFARTAVLRTSSTAIYNQFAGSAVYLQTSGHNVGIIIQDIGTRMPLLALPVRESRSSTTSQGRVKR